MPFTRPRNVRGEGERLREEIIDAAIKLLEKMPEVPYSLRAVAKEANVAAPSVYLHFKDSEALLIAVLERLYADRTLAYAAAEQEVIDRGGDVYELLLARSACYVRYAVERPGLYKAMYEGRIAELTGDPRLHHVSYPIYRRHVEIMAEYLEKNPSSAVEQDPERLSILTWAALHGICSLRLNKPQMIQLDIYELAAQIMRVLLKTGGSQ